MPRYYSIKDVAEKLKIPEYSIRYWIRELGINGNKRHNRRYFSEKDVNYFIGVKGLIDKGYTLKSIKAMIKEEGRTVLLRWAEKELSRKIINELEGCIKDVNALILRLGEIKNVH